MHLDMEKCFKSSHLLKQLCQFLGRMHGTHTNSKLKSKGLISNVYVRCGNQVQVVNVGSMTMYEMQ